MADNWSVTDAGLNREFAFRTFTDLTEFLRQIAVTADKMDHHPDLSVRKATLLNVHLITHDKKAITEKDETLAAEMDRVYHSFESR